jgi:hypothetical protein
MATSYTRIYEFVRTLVGDDTPEAYMYDDLILKSQVDWLIVELDDPLIVFGETVEEEEQQVHYFSNDLTNSQLAQVALQIAINLLLPNPDSFSYTSPVLSVRRGGASINLIQRLQDKLDQVNGGAMAIASDDEFSAFIYGGHRYMQNLQDAKE